MEYVLIALVGYLLGTSSMAFYLSIMTKKDVRKSGSGNLGASNTMALLGWKAAVLVGAHDIGKAWLAVLLAKWIFPNVAYAGAVAGVASVIGHIFPFYLKFKGGKGLASYIGLTAGLDIRLALVIVVVVLGIMILTDYIALGALAMVVIVPVVSLFSQGWVLALILCAATVVMIFKHIENLVRIFRGEEMGFRGAAKGKHRL
jgi:glycerol-3-phosphate acyltransferase PlsY